MKDVPLKEVREFRTNLLGYMRIYANDIIKEIDTGKVLSDDLCKRLEKVISDFKG